MHIIEWNDVLMPWSVAVTQLLASGVMQDG